MNFVNAAEEKIKDISEYWPVAVGSGIVCGILVKEAEDYLKKFRRELEHKKLALVVSSVAPIAKRRRKNRGSCQNTEIFFGG